MPILPRNLPEVRIAQEPSQQPPFPRRVFLLAGILAFEGLAAAQIHHPWFALHQAMAIPIVFCTVLVFFGRVKLRTMALDAVPIQWKWVALHLVDLAVLLAFELRFSHTRPQGSSAFQIDLTVAWIALLAILVVSLLGALFQLRSLPVIARRLGPAWLYAGICSVLAVVTRDGARALWDSHSVVVNGLQNVAFTGVSFLLRLLYPQIIADPVKGVLGTSSFFVEVSGACSGIEGLVLVLVLTVGWMFFMRRELRLGRVLWMIPIALVFIWLLNILRITALLVIGISGHSLIARSGFHSEAGWITFNLVSLAFLMTAQHVAWFRKAAIGEPSLDPEQGTVVTINPAAAYLVPFLAIVAASMVSQAGAGHFEWLYPLRFLAAAVALFYFRKTYRNINWRGGWLGVVAGLAIGAMWVALNHVPERWSIGGWHMGLTLQDRLAAFSFATGLRQLSPLARVGWLTCRVAAAIVTVPIAEELAFRGFVARRIQAREFETLPYRDLRLPAILVSSLLFGAMHGRMWPAGIVAGLVFAAVARWRGRLGEAVLAHAVANLVLAATVLTRSDYSLW